jgi:alpha-tubulin suppressor-like RCC1 family protein
MRSLNNLLVSIAAAVLLAACGGGQSGAGDVARSAAAREAAEPSVQEMEPAPNSLNVPRTTELVIRFTQPIIFSSVGRQTLRLVGPTGQVSGHFDGSTCGIVGPCEFPSGVSQHVVFRPDAPLQPSTQYHVEVAGVRTTGGVPVARYRTVFTTAIEHGHDSRLSAGGGNSCVVLEGGQVKCWGINSAGQLGIDSDTDHGGEANHMGAALPPVALGAGRTAVQVAVGDGHSCALLDDAPTDNTAGYLGLGDTHNRGDNSQEMGANLPAVNVGTGRRVAQVAMGFWHTCALLDDGSLKCWGRNHKGQLGLGNTQDHGATPGGMGDGLPFVDLGGRHAVRVTAGELHTCAVLDDQSVRCWGSNEGGRLGLGTTTLAYGDQPNQMGAALPAIQLGGGLPLAVSAGKDHTCARLADALFKCWGLNYDGQLGLGDTQARGDQAGEMAMLPPVDLAGGVVAVSAGGSFGCARLLDAAVKCWGHNKRGQLGLRDKVYRGDQAGEMGAALPALSF